MNAVATSRLMLETELREAVRANAFELHHQPLVTLKTGGIAGYEALIRWRHPIRGLVQPGEFIPLAEELGLIEEIGEFALTAACAAAARWPDELTVAVNVSARQLRREGFAVLVDAVLADTGLESSRLELEITEETLVEEGGSLRGNLAYLRKLGVRLVMDDFGVGYCSRTICADFPSTSSRSTARLSLRSPQRPRLLRSSGQWCRSVARSGCPSSPRASKPNSSSKQYALWAVRRPRVFYLVGQARFRSALATPWPGRGELRARLPIGRQSPRRGLRFEDCLQQLALDRCGLQSATFARTLGVDGDVEGNLALVEDDDIAVLATGHSWASPSDTGFALPSQTNVTILGTDLSMVDLRAQSRSDGYRGTVTAVPRRKLVPLGHGTCPPPIRLPDVPFGQPLSATMRWLRDLAAQVPDWRSAVDAIRPYTQKIWQTWPLDARRRFLRHARRYRDVHGHRIAPTSRRVFLRKSRLARCASPGSPPPRYNMGKPHLLEDIFQTGTRFEIH